MMNAFRMSFTNSNEEPTRPRWSRRHHSCWTLLGVTSLAIFTLFVIATFFSSSISNSLDKELRKACSAREYVRPYDVVEDHKYYDMTPSGDHVWDDLFTENQGYVFRQYRPEDQDADSVRMYGISMFHQLHCLQIIRATIQAMAYNTTTTSDEPSNTDSSSHKHHHHHDLRDDHWLHCFDFLRQTILCHADDTLEAPYVNEESGGDIINGSGPRMCRSNQWLYDWSAASGPSLGARRKAAREGKPWLIPDPEGIVWPEPLS